MGQALAPRLARGVNRLEEAVAEAAEALDQLGIPYMIIGGFAVTLWGEPRLTQDIDATVALNLSDRLVIDRLTQLLPARVTAPSEFARRTRVLPVSTSNGTSVDLILAGLPFEQMAIERAVPVEIGGRDVRVCAPEDLIVHKVISERPRDREDVRGIVRRQGSKLDRAYLDPLVEQLAEALAQPDILEAYRAAFQA